MEHPGVVAGNFAPSFHSTFWAFLCISKAPFGRSLWSGHHWKDLFLLQKLSIDDAKFGQKSWHQKRKKGQGSSWATGGTGINGLNRFRTVAVDSVNCQWLLIELCLFYRRKHNREFHSPRFTLFAFQIIACRHYSKDWTLSESSLTFCQTNVSSKWASPNGLSVLVYS